MTTATRSASTKLYKRLVAGKPVLVAGAQTGKQAAARAGQGSERRAQDRGRDDHEEAQGVPQGRLEDDVADQARARRQRDRQVPPQIGKLTELEELSLADCGLAELPEEIGKLTKLKILRVGGNITFDWSGGGDEARVVPIVLPKSIAKCTALEELDVSVPLRLAAHRELGGRPRGRDLGLHAAGGDREAAEAAHPARERHESGDAEDGQESAGPRVARDVGRPRVHPRGPVVGDQLQEAQAAGRQLESAVLDPEARCADGRSRSSTSTRRSSMSTRCPTSRS